VTTAQSAHLKEKFIGAFCELGNVKAACKRAGITRRKTVYDWREDDADFATAWAEAEMVATETLEAEAWRRATRGVRNTTGVYFRGEEIARHVKVEYSDTLLIFLLKARAPEKYRETVRQEHTGPQGGSIEVKHTVDDASAQLLADLLAVGLATRSGDAGEGG
jgi:Bacteriophage Sf6, terminase small subunit-like